MISDTTAPSYWFKFGAASARLALWLLVCAWALVGIGWVGLRFFIVPRIAELRPMLEQQATRVLGRPVQIGAVRAQSGGLIPSFELQDVRLLDAQGQVALELPQVLVALSARSLLNGGLEQLVLNGPALDVQRKADGQVWVAGFALGGGERSGAVDWLLAQPEIAIRHGSLRWSDALRAQPSVQFTDIDWVLRKSLQTHALRLDATPPPAWGARLQLTGIFKQPLLALHPKDWHSWSGQLYADFRELDLPQLQNYADLGLQVAQGRGALRAWIDVQRGQVTGATADLALRDAKITVAEPLQALDMAQVSGRLGVRSVAGGHEFSTQGLAFVTGDGLRWPGGNVRLLLQDETKPGGSLQADRLDLAALAQIATRLPLDALWRSRFQTMAPQGLVEQITASWQGPVMQPSNLTAQGRVRQLRWTAFTDASGQYPGLQGADVDFDLNAKGGHASVTVRKGSIAFPGLFDEPLIALDDLRSDVQWQRDATRLSVTLPNLRFANADAQGQAQLRWHSGPPGTPGTLDLQGSMGRAQGQRVYRYLPAVLPRAVRDYVQQSVQGGNVSALKFKVQGDLRDFPFAAKKAGEFQISAHVQDATYAYVPGAVQAHPLWPALSQLSGDFLLERDQIQIKNASAAIAGLGGLRIAKGQARIDLGGSAPTVSVDLSAQGPLAQMVAYVNSAPLGAQLGQALEQASASGSADLRLHLGLPLAALERSTVQGSVQLADNELQLRPEMPRLAHLHGGINFSDSGFNVNALQGHALGGDLRIDGGLNFTSTVTAAKAPTLHVQGSLSAEGLLQAHELGALAHLGQFASGATSYSMQIGWHGGMPDVQISSALVGLGLRLPAPLAKSAQTPLPLRLGWSPVDGQHGQDQLKLDLDHLLNLHFVRDVSGASARLLRGSVAVGLTPDELPVLPDTGVMADVRLASIDLDAWSTVLDTLGTPETPAGRHDGGASLASAYLPDTVALRAEDIVIGGRRVSHLVLGASRDGTLWRANLDAGEADGYFEYRPSVGSVPGRLYARLAHLVIGQSTGQDVENLLDQQPSSIPALDVVVDDFELRGKKLGRLEVNAVNLGAGRRGAGREWRLNQLNLSTPEAQFTASGNWVDINAQGGSALSLRERRRTVLNVKLDIRDAGEMLARQGMVGVFRKGHGLLEGQVSWLGSPLTFDIPSLDGQIKVNVEDGQFLKADPGIAKLLGVLSLQSLPRRLVLDFRDVFSEGFAFDFVRGDVAIARGTASTNNLQMKGVSAAVLMEGQADIVHETQHIKVVVVPEINAGGASLLATTINPLVGLSTFLAQWILRRPLIESATQELLIDGTWVDPHVSKVERKPQPPASSVKRGEP